MFSTSTRARTAMVVFAIAPLVATACSSSGSGGANSGSGPATTAQSAAADNALLGPVNQASGAPIRIGYINDGQSQGVDARPEVGAAQAAVKYVNEHLGGIGGRPLELLTCATNVTPAGAADCANQMIAAKMPVVLSAAPSQPATITKALQAARIPYFAYNGLDQTMLLSPDAYVLANPLGSLAAPIKLAKDSGLKKVAMILINLPAAVGPIESVAPAFYKSAGLSVAFTAIAPGTPDMTPQIQGALSNGAQEFNVIGDPAFCISALKALKTLGFTGKIIINVECFSSQLASSVPGGIDGVEIGANAALDGSDKEVALYQAVMGKYAPDISPHASANADGYAVVVGFARAMTGASGTLTPDAVRTSLASMTSKPLPLLAGQTFKCDRTAVSLTPAACSKGVAIFTVDASGKVKKTEAFDSTPYLKLG